MNAIPPQAMMADNIAVVNDANFHACSFRFLFCSFFVFLFLIIHIHPSCVHSINITVCVHSQYCTCTVYMKHTTACVYNVQC